MLISKELKRALFDTSENKITQFSYAGSVFTLRVSEKNQQLKLSAPVYWGGNYIPQGVRACVSKKAPFDEKIISTYLTIDEPNFSIELHYEGNLSERDDGLFDHHFEEFGFLVNEWKEWLDQHDKNDLVHIYNKR